MPGIYIGITKYGGVLFSFTLAQAPTILILSVISGTQIDLTWTSNSASIEDGFSIERSTDNIIWGVVGTNTTNDVTYSDTTCASGTLYYYRVNAYKGSVFSLYTNTTSATTWTAGEVAIRTGNTLGWYIASDLTTITKDASDRVSAWNDKLASGRNLLQAGADNIKPVWSINGLTFDGVRQYIKAAAFTYNQPELIYIVFKMITWTSSDYIFEGNTHDVGAFWEYGGTNGITGYAGTAYAPSNYDLTLDTFGIVRVSFNGASSFTQVNAGTPVVVNFGAGNMGGFTLGSRSDGAATFSNILVKEIILRNITDSSGDQTSIYNYLKAKYSL
jgi:hypothetical protein